MKRKVNINKPTYENRTFIKNLEISFTILSVVLLTIGVMVIMYGSASFKNYYVEPVSGQKFFETIIEFLKVTIEYSTDFYVGILVICLSVISFIFAMSAFIYDFEFYQEKEKEIIVSKDMHPKSRTLLGCMFLWQPPLSYQFSSRR